MHWHGCRSVALLLLLNGRVDIANDGSGIWQGCENERGAERLELQT